MSKRRNWFKITIAMITLIATVLETGFTSVSTLAAETTTEEGIVVDTDAVEENEQPAEETEQPAEEAEQPAEEAEQPAEEAEQPAEETEQPTEEAEQPAEETEQPEEEAEQPEEEAEQPEEEAEQPEEEAEQPAEETEQPEEGEVVEEEAEQPEEEEVYEEAEELKEGTLEISDDGISGSGYDEISIYVNTDDLANKDRFRLEFTGPDSASYNPIINEDLDRTNGGRYDFENLEGGDFTVRANSSENVILSYKYNEDGYPMIVLESKAVDKVLETRTLTSEDDSQIQAVSGEGFDSITVKFNTEELSETAAFKLVVESDAEATVNGADAREGITGLDRNTDSLTIEGLDQESFVAYVLSDKDDVKLSTIADIDSVEDGAVTFTVDNVDTKRIYDYEDSKVKVTAVLEKADAVPDDAYFDVTPLTEEEAEKYLEALNADHKDGDVLATADNTLLYDIGFYTDESKSEEIEPEEGSVRISIDFKRDQLAEDIGAENEEDIVVIHITEEGSGLTTEEVEAKSSVDEGTVDFTTDTFSTYAIHNKSLNFKSGTLYSYTDILGQAVNYGFVAGTYQSGSHVDSNFATKVLKGSAQITAGKYTGNGNPGNYIIGDYNDKGFWVDASKPFVIYVDESDVDNFNANMNSRPVIYNTDFTTDQLQSQVDSLITGTKSSDLYNESKNNTNWLDNIYGSDQKYHLDLTQYPAGTYYFKFGDNEFSKISQADKLRVYINSDQNVVFNVPDKSVNVEKFLLSIDGNDKYSDASDSSTDPYCRKVVFNMPNATKVNLNGVFGIFLAPQADVNIGTTSTGWLVCGGKFTNNGEWHGTWQDMPETFGTTTQFFAKKTVNNNPPAADEVFSFELYTYDFNTGYSSKPVQTKQNAGELITFDPINYSYDDVKKAGGNKTYAYKIVEKATNKDGYTLDSAEYIIHVKVRVEGQYLKIYEKNVYKGVNNPIGNDYTKDGTLVKFNNTHTTREENDRDSYTLKIKKILKDKKTGKELKYWPTSFKFKVYPEYEDKITPVDKHMPVPSPNPKEIIISSGNDNVKDVLTININAKEYFEHLNPYTHDGYVTHHINWNLPGGGVEEIRGSNFKYRIEEIKVNDDGIEYGTPLIRYIKLLIDVSKVSKNGVDTYTIVTDNNTDSANYGLKIRPKYSINNENCVEWGHNPVEFVNQYEAEGSTKIYGQKIVDNVKYNAGDFTFVLKDSTGKVLETVTNDANGKINFKHEFKYTLADMDDQKSKVFTYTIEEDVSKSKIKDVKCISDNPITFNITVTNNGTIKNKKRVLDITNPYGSCNTPFKFTNSKTVEGDIVFSVKKVNTSNDPELADKKFKFTLKGLGDDSNISQTVEEVGVNEVRAFDKIDYKKINSNTATTHKYQIYEVNDGQGGVIYDGRKYNIEVKVSLDKETGNFKKEIWAGYDDKLEPKDDGFVVIAEFNNGYDLKETTDFVEGDKTLTGKELEANEFTFKIEPYGDDTKEAVKPSEEGKTATVVMPEKTEVQNQANGSFKFDNITFKKAGIYTFMVTEIPADDSKYINDASEYIVTIPVKDINGQLTVDTKNKTITKNGTPVGKISFDNTYKGKGEITLYARKNFSGRTLKNGEFTFTLESNDGVNPGQTVTNNGTTVKFDTLRYTTSMMKDGNGKPVKEKTFTYNIKETVPEEAKKTVKDGYYYLNGVYYDRNAESDHIVTVTVTQNADGTLTATADKNASSSTASEVEFVNFYKADGSFDIVGSKIITGRKFVNRTVNEKKLVDKFTFKLTGPEGSGIEREVTVTPEDGTSMLEWAFRDITFNETNYTKYAGVYTVEEEAGGGAVVDGKPVRNDETLYHVYVTLTDDGKGTINHDEIYYKDSKDSPLSAITFRNEYDAEGTLSLEAHKTLKKGTIKPKMFKFFLKDEAGEVIDEKWNGEGADNEEIDAKIAIFKDIKYTLDQLEQNDDGTYKPRTFHYTIGEYDGKETYINYNVEKELYTVEVTVSDDGSGTLDVQKIYKNVGNSIVEQADFVNEYKTKGDEVIYARKILEGRTLKDGDFTFILTDENGFKREAKVVADKNGKEGRATFEKLLFDQDDLDPDNPKFTLNHATTEKGKYARYYTLREYIPDDAKQITEKVGDTIHTYYKYNGCVYDDTVYSVVVTLKDDGEGTIDTDWVAYPEGSVQPDDLKWYEALWSTVVEWFGGDSAQHRADFTNTYETTGALQLTARKSITGKENKAGEFTFRLSGKDQNDEEFTYDIPTGEDFVSVFPKIQYTKEGDYTYTIEEVIPEGAVKDDGEGGTGLMMKDGVKYDDHHYKVDVSVRESDENGNGKLTVTIKVDDEPANLVTSTAKIDNKEVDLYTIGEPVLFSNTYKPEPVRVNLGGDKLLVGRDLEEGDVFSFKITAGEGTKLPKGYNDTVTVQYFTGNNGTFKFPEITYTADDMRIEGQTGKYATSKVFNYTISEVIPEGAEKNEYTDDKGVSHVTYKKDGITYDGTTYNVAVTVTDDLAGNLSAKVTSNGAEKEQDKVATFKNTYDAKGQLDLSVYKLVYAPETSDDEERVPVSADNKVFDFELTGDGITTPLTAHATNGGTGEFAAIPYKLADLGPKNSAGKYEKVFTYYVNEIKGEEERDLLAEDDDPDNDGGYEYTDDYYEVVVTVTSDGVSNELGVSKVITKKNHKDPSVNVVCGDISTLEFDNTYYAYGHQIIEGQKRVSGNVPADNVYEFELLDENDKRIGDPVSTVNGGFSFKLDYTQKDIGTHHYKVKEIIPDEEEKDPDIDYDESVYEVTIIVTDKTKDDPNAGDGKLSVSDPIITLDNTDKTFDKCYFNNTDYEPNSIVFTAEKSFDGKELEDNMFTFTLTGDGQNQTVHNLGSKVTFNAIEYSLNDFAKGQTEKTYNYKITEKAECTKPGGISYIKTDYKAEVKVSLVNGKIEIDPKVTDMDNRDLKITVKDGENGGVIVSDIEFINKYTDSVDVIVGAYKHLNGFTDGATPLGTYTFELKDTDNNKVVQSMDISPEKAGEDTYFDFDPITFTQDDLRIGGKYLKETFRHYTLKEVIPTIKAANVTYETDFYNILVRLYYDKDGYLQAEVSADGISQTVKGKDKNGKDIVYIGGMGFTNTYAAEGDLPLGGIKTITGKNREEASYTFTLTGEDQNQEVKNKGKNFDFEPIHYEAKDIGTHTYYIKETAAIDGSEIDTRYYKVVVTVGEGSGGILDISKKVYLLDKAGNEIGELGKTEDISFENTFEAECEIPVSGIKRMYNKPLVGNEFTFVIKDEDGNILKDADGNEYKVTNTAAELKKLGNKRLAEVAFDFAPIKYDQEVLRISEDTYSDEVTKHYTVEELVEGVTQNEKGEYVKNGVKYSKAVYAMEVTISINKAQKKLDVSKKVRALKDQDGEYLAKVEESTGIKKILEAIFKTSGTDDDIEKDEDGNDLIVFKNVYRLDCPIDPPLFTKEMMGKDLKPGEFRFAVDGPGLPSMKEEATGYHREVKNGLAKDKEGIERTYYLDRKGNRHDLNVGEIFVGDISYVINEDYYDLDLGDVKGFELLTDPFGDGKTYSKYTYTAKEIVPKKGDEDYDPSIDYTPAEVELIVYVADNGDGTATVRNQDKEIVEFNDVGQMISEAKLYWDPKTPNRVSPEEIVELNGRKVDLINIFEVEGSRDLVGIKSMKGRKLTKDDKFEFILTEIDENGNAIPGRSAKVENTNDSYSIPSIVAFNAKDIPFLRYRYGAYPTEEDPNVYHWVNDKGIHTYIIEEVQINKEGLKCDTAKFKVTVDVQTALAQNGEPLRKDGKGYLDARITEIRKIFSDNNTEILPNPPSGNIFEFKNEFEAKGKIDFDGIKYLKDQEGKNIVSKDSLKDQFEFAIYQYKNAERTEGKDLIYVTKTDEKGQFKLVIPEYTQDILKRADGEYDTEKTLYYRIIETKPTYGVWSDDNTVFESDGIVYDNTEYDVDVTVKNVGTGQLEVTSVIKKAATGETVTKIGYTNIVKKYRTIEGNKFWNDGVKDPKDRPDVTVNLYSKTASGVVKKINTYTIKAPDTTYRFATDSEGNKLPVFDSEGRPITYEVEELPIEGYLSEQNGFDFYNSKGHILIRKIDADTRVPLAGAVLAIYDGSTEIEKWTSGASAHVVEADLKAGKTYTLRELSAPDGYELAKDMTFTVPEDGGTITVTMSDRPIVGSVRLIKRDASTRETLAGAEFALYTSGGTRIYATGSTGSYHVTSTTSNGVFVTDSSGSLTISDLPYGSYYFVETKAPDGYALSSEHLGFTVIKSGELVEVTFLDTKALGSVRLRKVSSTGSRALAGAVFELYAKTPKTVGQAAAATIFGDAYFRYGTYRTNSEGEIYVDNLPWDDYYFIEIEAPKGYKIATDVNGDPLAYTFTINEATSRATIDLGSIINYPDEEIVPPPTPTVTPTPTVIPPTGVLGERVKKGGVVNGVLGVRAKPTSGVLGERIGPVTGDASNIILWLLLLTACVATIVATIMTGRKKRSGTK